MQPLVSILIPAYNAEQWLAEAIESALAQTWKNLEIIVVNDGSKDNTLAVANQYKSSQVNVIDEENKGASAARNRAYQDAQGDFIQYLDADDILAADKVARQVQLLETGRSEYVAAGEWARFWETPLDAEFKPEPLWRDLSPIDWLVCAWGEQWMMHPAAWLVPRQIAEKAGRWNESLSLNDDGEYFSRVVLASQGVKFCWGARTYYRSYHPGRTSNLSASRSPESWASLYRSIEIGTANLLASENSPRTRQVCADVFQRFIYEAYPNVPDLRQQAQARVCTLGGSKLLPSGGSVFSLVSRLLGWKAAKRLQIFGYKYGYQKKAMLLQSLSFNRK